MDDNCLFECPEFDQDIGFEIVNIVYINKSVILVELVIPDIFDVSKEIILVTGASQGLGRQFARGLSAHGALHDRQRADGGWRVLADVNSRSSFRGARERAPSSSRRIPGSPRRAAPEGRVTPASPP